MMQPNSRRWGGPRRGIFMLPIAVIAILGLGGVVMLLWNAVLPPLVHVARIDYPRAIGLLILCRILFGRIGSEGPWRRVGGGPPHWKQKWAGMSEEEREKFREGWKKRCAEGKGGDGGQSPITERHFDRREKSGDE